jgi:hypothetical protein
MAIADAVILAAILAAGAFFMANRGSEGASGSGTSAEQALVTLVSGETNETEVSTLNLNEPGHSQPIERAPAASSSSESPVSIASSWSMPPLPEDGSWATSGTSQSPVTKSSSSVMALAQP